MRRAHSGSGSSDRKNVPGGGGATKPKPASEQSGRNQARQQCRRQRSTNLRHSAPIASPTHVAATQEMVDRNHRVPRVGRGARLCDALILVPAVQIGRTSPVAGERQSRSPLQNRADGTKQGNNAAANGRQICGTPLLSPRPPMSPRLKKWLIGTTAFLALAAVLVYATRSFWFRQFRSEERPRWRGSDKAEARFRTERTEPSKATMPPPTVDKFAALRSYRLAHPCRRDSRNG